MTASLIKSYKVLTILILLGNVSSISAEDDHLEVDVVNGRVRGSKNKTVGGNNTYYAFRGIPFAKPPLGDLRFKEPQPANNWTGTFDATKEGNICLQGLNAEGSEDCLYINVYVPGIPHTSNRLPVLVWIYGGGFFGGASTYNSSGPDYILDEGILFVSFNYRLGPFGFLSTEDIVAPGNYGLKDQVLALKWVHNNIKHFGGDPGNVTVFGESAGAASASYMQITSQTKGLFQKVILNSGNSISLWALNRRARNFTILLSSSYLISTSSSESMISGLRKIDARSLQRRSIVGELGGFLVNNIVNGFIHGPVIEPNHEDAIITSSAYNLLESGNYNKVPTLMGFNSLETAFTDQQMVVVNSYLLGYGYELDSGKLVPGDMNIADTNVKRNVGMKIKKYYYGNLPMIFNASATRKIFSDIFFVNPITKSASLMSNSTSVYLYRFSYEGALGSQGTRTTEGVSHAEDLGYIFRRDFPASTADKLTRERMVKLWTNFVKTGNPTPAKDTLLQNVSWPKIDSTSKNITYLDIGRDLLVKRNPEENAVNFWKHLYETYGRPPFYTYKK